MALTVSARWRIALVLASGLQGCGASVTGSDAGPLIPTDPATTPLTRYAPEQHL